MTKPTTLERLEDDQHCPLVSPHRSIKEKALVLRKGSPIAAQVLEEEGWQPGRRKTQGRGAVQTPNHIALSAPFRNTSGVSGAQGKNGYSSWGLTED